MSDSTSDYGLSIGPLLDELERSCAALEQVRQWRREFPSPSPDDSWLVYPCDDAEMDCARVRPGEGGG
jgi:hypothetical protein